MKKTLSLLLFLVLPGIILSQALTNRYAEYGRMFVPQFSSAPFPDSLRTDGRTYNGTVYSAAEHYSDSSVAIFIPKGFRPSAATDLVVYFHGWFNNIDSACAQFRLIEQFAAAGKNAVFVFPEGPKDAPDSYGGRMEGTEGLRRLVDDVLSYLKNRSVITESRPGKIVLAGHSGAYRVIAYCLMRGGLTDHVSDVVLFDALYAETEKFAHWIDRSPGRFVNIYTDSGGTKYATLGLMADLDGWGVPYRSVEEQALTDEDLTGNRLIFIHTELSHNEVIARRDQFRRFIATSGLAPLTH